MNLCLGQDLGIEKFFRCLGRKGKVASVKHGANALLTFAQAESTAKLHLVAKAVLRDQTLQGFDDLTRTL